MDTYVDALNGIAEIVENIYGITNSNIVGNNDIACVISGMDKLIMSMDASEMARKNEEVGRQIVLLAYVSERLSYFESVRLDFSMFPVMDEVVNILRSFTDKKNFNRCVRQVNKLIKVLEEVDATSVKARYGLGYRYLRIFIVLVMYRSSCNAAIVSKFIARQVIMKARNL